jgi:hypothetical protein
MYMSFDRHQHTHRASHSSTADATGTPFTMRHTPNSARPNTENKDYREQADGAP